MRYNQSINLYYKSSVGVSTIIYNSKVVTIHDVKSLLYKFWWHRSQFKYLGYVLVECDGINCQCGLFSCAVLPFESVIFERYLNCVNHYSNNNITIRNVHYLTNYVQVPIVCEISNCTFDPYWLIFDKSPYRIFVWTTSCKKQVRSIIDIYLQYDLYNSNLAEFVINNKNLNIMQNKPKKIAEYMEQLF